MPERVASPRLIKFVRRALRANPNYTFEEVLASWKAQSHSDDDPELVRTIYNQELAARNQPPASEAAHTRIVLITIAIWVVVHTAIALGIGLPTYIACRAQVATGGPFQWCGFSLGLTFLGVGAVQVVYGLIAAAIAFRVRRAVAQGILIGLSTVLVGFTIVCFGASATR
jgi:hypothetical protein